MAVSSMDSAQEGGRYATPAPAYMLHARISDVALGIERAVAAFLELA